MVYVETPTNPLMEITDLAARAELAHEAARCWRSTTPSCRPTSSGRSSWAPTSSPLDDQVPERPQRLDRRRAGGHHAGARRLVRLRAEVGRRRSCRPSTLPGAARHQDPAGAHGAPRAQRPRHRRLPRRPPEGAQGALPGAADTPRPRRPAAPGERLRRHDQLRPRRLRRRQAAARRPGSDEPRREPRAASRPDRPPGDDDPRLGAARSGGASSGSKRRPGAHLGGHRGRGRRDLVVAELDLEALSPRRSAGRRAVEVWRAMRRPQ
jgi:hypothetical protein